ncbi:hypothetical protein [Paenibacillus sp. Y412MC10]|nr:hypothetical protein [Paenibacillus sp. Y412MC10]
MRCIPNSSQADIKSPRFASVKSTFDAPMPATARSSSGSSETAN